MKPVLSDCERDLLIAALARNGAEVLAFDRWMAQTDFNDPVDPGHYRLFPLLYSNLTRAGVAPSRLSRLRGVYRHSWAKSHAHIARTAEAVTALSAAGVPVIVLKGLVLARTYYDSPALRPMSDIDLYVPFEDVRAAMGALRGIGYLGSCDLSTLSERRYGDFTVMRHGDVLRRSGDEVDLHWYLMKLTRHAAANRRFWAHARPFDVAPDVRALQLRAEDMLLHVVLHGLQQNVMSPLRWIADATMIIRRTGAALDWDALFDVSAELKVESHLRAGLETLRTFEVVDLPAWPRRPRATFAERAERWAYGKSAHAHLAADLVRMLGSDARSRLPRLASASVARRIGLL